VQDRQTLLETIEAFTECRERDPELRVLSSFQPAPRPSLDSPPLISSAVPTSCAKVPGRRKVIGETSTPSPIRSVSRARPATTVQASVVGRPASPGKLV
jgi:hypothetical protein